MFEHLLVFVCVCILNRLGCYDKLLQIGWFTYNKQLFFIALEARNVTLSALADLVSGEHPLPTEGCLPPLSSHRGTGEGLWEHCYQGTNPTREGVAL